MSGSYNVLMRKLRRVGGNMKEAILGLVQFLTLRFRQHESKQWESLKESLEKSVPGLKAILF